MADVCDLGAERAEQLLDDALAQRRARQAGPAAGALYCEDCDAAIALARRQAVPGCVTCVECQSLREVRRG